ncbi:hypothetical protein QBC40DRAFT_308612 [Triangularia verruculosa]|uniref:MOSC domain-containing protein n=1 Tax=Triangularia verruculosa TaxID=2587418 RepID=A0AAN7ATJ6_9PEZI|nr:hypothetical protein QBC40DRAFT_308612 [Triangularia verruculosa]
METKSLYVYPIKALRGIKLQSARIGPQGIAHDRTFMLFQISEPDGELKKMQVDSHPQCALFEQRLSDDTISVRYRGPEHKDHEEESLLIPLTPDTATLSRINVNLHGSAPSSAYSMGTPYEDWFSARFGFPVKLVYLGDGKRAVLGDTLPPKGQQKPAAETKGGWLSSLTSYVTGKEEQPKKPWITFTDVAPLLVTSESSLHDVSTRLPPDEPMPMYKFRPNIVVDGQGEEAWAEDLWAELTVDTKHKLLLTGNCVRCTSLNVDYETGKPAAGELGGVLKKLMKDRRVDAGSKWSPVFGRYAFPAADQDDQGGYFELRVGEEVEITKRNTERTVWDWPGL